MNGVYFPMQIREREMRLAPRRTANIDPAGSGERDSLPIRRIGQRSDWRMFGRAGNFRNCNRLKYRVIDLRTVRAFGDPFLERGELGGGNLRLVLRRHVRLDTAFER